jgi:hypothetical protein
MVDQVIRPTPALPEIQGSRGQTTSADDQRDCNKRCWPSILFLQAGYGGV